jgi:hypothetical protein
MGTTGYLLAACIVIWAGLFVFVTRLYYGQKRLRAEIAALRRPDKNDG